MPGLTVCLARPPHAAETFHRLHVSQFCESHTPSYGSRVGQINESICVGLTSYPEYPLAVHRTDNALAIIDGAVYDKPEREFFDAADRFDASPTRAADMVSWLAQWLAERDAECIFLYAERDPAGSIILANDLLGRLPFYIEATSQRFCGSRSIKHIVAVADSVEPDVVGVTQSLIFGYPLGTRTLLQGIAALPAATIVTVSQTTARAQYRQYHGWTFDDVSASAAKPTSADAIRLAAHLVESTARRCHRFPHRPCVLLLSGGLDSRAVAGTLNATRSSAVTLTYDDGTGFGARECVLGERIAAACGLPWHRLAMVSPRPWEFQQAIELRDGLNYGAMATQFQAYRAAAGLVDTSPLLMTGDGGDKAMPDLHPASSVRSLSGLARMIAAQTPFLGVEVAAALTHTPAGDIRRSIESLVESYPERACRDRYVHFTLMERGRRWLYEGEERGRAFQWLTTPFYGHPFFREALQIPMAWKASGRWYAMFLKALTPALAEIPDVNTDRLPGAPLDWRKRVRGVIARLPALERAVRNVYLRHRAKSSLPGWQPLDHATLFESEMVQSAFDDSLLSSAYAHPQAPTVRWQLNTILWYLRVLDQTATARTFPAPTEIARSRILDLAKEADAAQFVLQQK